MAEIFNKITNRLFARVVGKEQNFGIFGATYGWHDFKRLKGSKSSRTQEHFTLHYVLSGKGILNAQNATYEVDANECFLIAPNYTFSYYPNESQPWEYIWLGFSGDESYILNLFDNAGIKHGVPHKIGGAKTSVLNALSKLEFNDNSSAEVASVAVVCAVFEILCAVHKQREFSVDTNLPKLVKEILEYININYLDNNFSVAKTADMLSISHPYMCRLFLKHMGTTVKNYVSELRLKKACELLSFNDISIKEVAFASGFSDDIHFSKSFRRKFGMTAGQFRKNNFK